MNEDIEVLDFEEANDEEIETLDENDNKSEENKEINDNGILNKQQEQDEKQNSKETEGTVIDINRLFDVDEKEEKIAEEEIKKESEKKDKKIFKIQIGLIVALVLIASLVYFFGYNLFEPFIKID
mgnify:FL=1